MRRERYVHGWEGPNQCVYGKDEAGNWQWVDPCSLQQAKRIRRNIIRAKVSNYRIYKLVEVKP